MLKLAEAQWDEIHQEGLELFKNLLRINTTNPPGGETAAAEFLAEALGKDGIGSEILEAAPGRGNLLARLGAQNAKDGPLLLNSHTDVVLAEPEFWSRPPFAAEDDGTYLYGRGTLDMKNMVVYELMTAKLLKRLGAELRRDVIFVAVADEETGCDLGSRWLVQNHADKVRADIGLGEVGGFSMTFRGVRYYPVMTAAKGVCWLRLKGRGDPGHGSLQRKDSSVQKLARALARLSETRLPYHQTDTMRAFVQALAAPQKPHIAAALKGMLIPQVADVVIERLMPEGIRPSFFAQLHNTINPTILRAGEKINVIPAEAAAECDGRTLPGQAAGDLIREVRGIAGDEVDIEVIRDIPAFEVRHDDPVMARIAEVNRRHDPGGHVIPFLSSGFTDGNWFSTLGMRCFGYSPVRLPEEESFTKRFHGHDERIPLAGFRFGLRAFVELVWELAC